MKAGATIALLDRHQIELWRRHRGGRARPQSDATNASVVDQVRHGSQRGDGPGHRRYCGPAGPRGSPSTSENTVVVLTDLPRGTSVTSENGSA